MITHKQRTKKEVWCKSKLEWNTLIDKQWKKTNCRACFQEALKDRTRTSYDTAKRWFTIKKEKGELV